MNESQNRIIFLRQLESRLEKGAQEYGNQSFNKSFKDLSDEILQEYLDIAGWAYISWARAKAKLDSLEQAMMHIDSTCESDAC